MGTCEYVYIYIYIIIVTIIINNNNIYLHMAVQSSSILRHPPASSLQGSRPRGPAIGSIQMTGPHLWPKALGIPGIFLWIFQQLGF